MVMTVAASGAGDWVVLVIAGVAGLAFGMLINSLLARRRKK
jgi:uncharacterized membrane-anchored protein YhcB (DUF1043 family)